MKSEIPELRVRFTHVYKINKLGGTVTAIPEQSTGLAVHGVRVANYTDSLWRVTLDHPIGDQKEVHLTDEQFMAYCCIDSIDGEQK